MPSVRERVHCLRLAQFARPKTVITHNQGPSKNDQDGGTPTGAYITVTSPSNAETTIVDESPSSTAVAARGRVLPYAKRPEFSYDAAIHRRCCAGEVEQFSVAEEVTDCSYSPTSRVIRLSSRRKKFTF